MNNIFAQQTPKDVAAILSKLERMYSKYDEAADSVYQTISQQLEAQQGKPDNEAVWHSCMAEFLRNYYQQNRYLFYDRTPVEGEPSADFKVWDFQTLVKQIVFHYQQSLRNEEFLSSIPIRDWAPILDSVIAVSYRPTLYDFLAFRALDFLGTTLSEMPIPVTPFDVNNGKYWSENRVFTNMNITSPDEYSFSFISLCIMQTLTRQHLHDKDPYALLDVTLRRYEYLSHIENIENASEIHLKELLKLEEQYRGNSGYEMVTYSIGKFYQRRGKHYDKDSHPEYKMDYATAIEWYRKTIEVAPKSIEASNAQVAIEELTRSSVCFAVTRPMPTQQSNLITFQYLNSQNLNFRVIPMTTSEFNNIPYNEIFARSINKKPVYETSLTVPDEGDYRSKDGHFLIPPIKQGSYLLLATNGTFDRNNKREYAYQMVQFTNLAANYRNNNNLYEVFVFDRVSGQPIEGATVTIKIFSDYQHKKVNGEYKLTSDKDGRCQVNVKPNVRGQLCIDATYKGESITLLNNGWMYWDGVQDPDEQVTDASTYIFTDRNLYRPGQTVYYKGIVVNRTSLRKGGSTISQSIVANIPETVILRDVNHQEVAKAEHTTNEYGSFSGSFTLPSSGLTGSFVLQCNHGSFRISVEEYKRPTFDVKMETPKEQFKLEQEVHVSGNVRAYAGYAIDGADVRYSVVREASFPWWRCWWWRPMRPAQQIASGTVTSDADGKFTIVFTAQPDLETQQHNPLYTYIVKVDVTDITGETHSTRTSVHVSKNGLILEADIPEQVEANDPNRFTILATNLGGEPQPSTIHYDIFALQTPSEYRYKCPKHDFYLSDSTALHKALPYLDFNNEQHLENWKVLRSVGSGDFNSNGTNKFSIPNLGNLPEGSYKITFTTHDSDGNDIQKETYFTLYKENSKKSVVYKPIWIHTSSETKVEVGNTIQVTVETFLKNAMVLMEITSNERLVKSDWVKLNQGKTTLSYTLTEKDLGTVKFSAFTIQNNNQYQESLTLSVPYSHLDIDFEFLSFRDKTQPGSEEQYQIWLKNRQGYKVDAELLCAMYDASLDALASPHDFAQRIISWRHGNYNTSLGVGKMGSFLYNRYYHLGSSSAKTYKTRNYPSLKFKIGMEHYFGHRMYKTTALGSQEVVLNIVEDNISVNTDLDFVEDEVMEVVELEGTDEVPAVMFVDAYYKNTGKEDKESNTVRTNFAETAFFYPNLHTDEEGNVFITFTMPESLTRWKLLGFAHNTDLMSGHFEKFVQTSKKLMVVPNAPRFLREGDTLLFTAKVVNMDSVTQCGNVTLSLRNPFNNQPIEKIVEGSNVLPFDVKPGESQEVQFHIVVPQNLGAVTYRIEARNLETPAYADGEEATLPVLTNRILVTESLPLHISGKGSKTFTFERMKKSFATKSNTLTTQSLTLEFTPNPIWYAIQAMPYLMEYPYECNEQIFSRYYANTLAANIVNSHPRVKEVFNEWLNATPDAFCSQLEKNPELKSILIEETPWLLDAQNESSRKQNISLLFDLGRMSKEQKAACHKLVNRQNSDGGWSWFAGGESSSYITEHIVAGLGHLNVLHVPIDIQDFTIHKAVGFMDRKMNEYYQKWQKGKNSCGWGDIHYLYARSFFLDKKVHTQYQEAYNYNYQNIKKEWKNQSIYMQGMIALICYRNGDTQLAKQIIANIKSLAQYNEEMGMFWKKSGYGWFWYEAPIERQALLIEAFNTITHDAESVEKMQLWLLKQKQTQSWPTTKSTTEAIYALLLNNTQLENEKGVTLTLGDRWIYTEGDGSMQAEAGTGYIKNTWKGGDVTADMSTLKIDKQTSGPAWGGLYWQYLENLDKVEHSQDGCISIQKQLYKVGIGDRGEVLTAITEDSPLKVGDRVRVRVEIRTDRDMEYVHLKDMRASCFEPTNVLSGYRHQDGLWYYESTRDAATNFFIDYLPKGTYVFEYTLVATMPGAYSNGLTTIQCMYAPEFTSHSEGIRVSVK